MKKTILLNLIFLLIFSLTTLAQNETPAKVEWKNFKPKGEEYSLQIPADLTRSSYNNEENNQSFSVKFDNRFFFVFSENIKSESPDKTIEKFLTDAEAKPAKVKINNFDGEKYSFKYSDDYFHTLLLVRTKSKIYAFHAAGEKEKDDVVDKFFESIKFDRKLNSGNIKIENPKTPENGGASVGDFGSSQNSGYGYGNSSELPKPTASENSPLKIISKPRANYTDFARFFDIQGSVTVRIIFLATGEVQIIDVTRKLPFGLTANSIEAAQKMRFEPMKQNGIAVSTTKSVEYSFTIY